LRWRRAFVELHARADELASRAEMLVRVRMVIVMEAGWLKVWADGVDGILPGRFEAAMIATGTG